MILFKPIFFSILVILCYCESVKSTSLRRLQRDGNFSNRPPNQEYYAPIPVAVVYDDSASRASRVSTSTEGKITTYHPSFRALSTLSDEEPEKTTVASTTSETIEPLEKKANTKANNLSKRRQSLTEDQIPVVVVYDPITEKNLKRNAASPESQSRSSNVRNIRNRTRKPTTTTEKVEDIQETSTVKILESADSSSKAPQTAEIQTEASRKSTEEGKKNTGIRGRKPSTKTTEKSFESTTEGKTLSVTIGQPRLKSRTQTQTREPVEKEETNSSQSDSFPSTTYKPRRRTKEPVVPIIDSSNFIFAHTGAFSYSFEGGDGTKAFEKGRLIEVNESNGEAVEGGYSYKSKDGEDISLTYTADENGYRPVGAHLPTPPPIPPAIARALRYLATKPTPQEDDVTEATQIEEEKEE